MKDSQQISIEKPTKELFKEYSVSSKFVYEESSLIESLRGLRSYSPLPSEAKEKNACIERIVREWFSQRMRKKYDELSPEIFELQRDLEISKKHFKDRDDHTDYSGEKQNIKIPLLLQAELDKDEGWKGNYEYYSSGTYKLTLFSRIPRIPFDVRKSGRETLALIYRTFSDALATEVLGDVITEHPDYAPHPHDAKLVVLWKPKPSDIHIEAKLIEKDPALVLKWDKPYLISTWKEPDEEPFMDLVNSCRLSNLDMFMEGMTK